MTSWRTELPLAAAPMAGGPTTVALSVAVAQAGAFPFLAAGYKTPQAMAEEIDQLRRYGWAFGVNLFVPDPTAAADAAAFDRYADSLHAEADQLGIALPPGPVSDDDHWPAKLAWLRDHPVPVVSLTFGLPDQADIATLQAVGTEVLATVTTPDEATRAGEAGVDALIVQGSAAGGHSAIHDPDRPIADTDTADLVAAIRHQISLPIMAAGGVDGPGAVARLLHAGATSVAVSTLLLRADEAGTSPTHRAALADHTTYNRTIITRAFTGRPARALANGFTDRHHTDAITAYPAVHHLTRPLRVAANTTGDADRLHLWAGTGWRHARAEPAADIISWLV
jgi:NAD(P)H-dependent flavin oxidoreductase YrpB (nitropropane dioxygenase family)